MTEEPRHSLARSVALIGLRGCGKSTVGRMLARRLGVRFVDTDELIEVNAGRSIRDIFEAEGEAGFRRRERKAIAGLAGKERTVVSVGGGGVLDPANAEILSRLATVVWLTASTEVLWRRIENDPTSAAARPPLTGRGGQAEIEHLAEVRAPAYERMADHRVDTDDLTPEQVARAIFNLLTV